MADFCSKYQAVLKNLEEFLKKDKEELAEEYKKRLTTLHEMFEILESIRGQAKGEESEVNQCKAVIVGLCSTLLFGPYMGLLIQASGRSDMVNEMKDGQQGQVELSAFPKFMQAKFDQIKRYLEKARGRLEEIDKLLSELIPKVRKARRYQFKIPDEELEDLKMDMEDVNCELDQCKNYLNEAENVLSMLKSDINSEIYKYRIKLVGVVSGTAGMILIGGVTYLSTQISQAIQYLGRGGFIAGTSLLTVSLFVGIWFIIDRHEASYKNNVAALEMALHELQTECRNMETKIKKRVVDRMEANSPNDKTKTGCAKVEL